RRCLRSWFGLMGRCRCVWRIEWITCVARARLTLRARGAWFLRLLCLVLKNQECKSTVFGRERVGFVDRLSVCVCLHAGDLTRLHAARFEHAPRFVGAFEGQRPVALARAAVELSAVGMAVDLELVFHTREDG